jgi:cytochrome c-type biogenesis protein CcmE
MNRYAKFGLPIAVIVGTLGWLAFSSTKETAGYFKTIPEVKQMGEAAHVKHLRVGGHVAEGSIARAGSHTTFLLVQNEGQADLGDSLKVVYTGDDPLPDTFKEHAEALADGKMGADGMFHAEKIQAKCASKYEGAPPPAAAPKPSTI